MSNYILYLLAKARLSLNNICTVDISEKSNSDFQSSIRTESTLFSLLNLGNLTATSGKLGKAQGGQPFSQDTSTVKSRHFLSQRR